MLRNALFISSCLALSLVASAQCEVVYSSKSASVDRDVVMDFLVQTSGGLEGGVRNRLFMADNLLSAFDGQVLQAAAETGNFFGGKALVRFDDGSGPGMIALGQKEVFFVREGQATLIPGNFSLIFDTAATLECAVVFDDGSGEKLYIGGFFETLDGQPFGNIAAWDGSSWSDVGGGFNRVVSALHVHDFGSGPQLVAGGRFDLGGGQSIGRVASWDGTAWNSVGVIPPDGPVRSLTTWNDGSSTRLVAGGLFQSADGQVCNSLASFGAGGWSPFGTGVATGGMTSSAGVNTLHTIANTSGAETLLIGGRFSAVDGVPANSAARLESGTWADMGQGLGPKNNYVDVFAFDEYSFSDGNSIVVGGSFFVGSTGRMGMARRVSNSWAPLLDPGPEPARVRGGASWDDGNGEALYVAGDFSSQGASAPRSQVARRNASGDWEDVGNGINGVVYAICSHDGTFRGSPSDASGVYALGEFTETVLGGANNVSLPGVARFDGSSWQPLGDGLGVAASTQRSEDWDLIVFDDGAGPRLYALGGITSILETGQILFKRVAAWDGVNWAPVPLPNVFEFRPACFEIYDSGFGPELYIAGYGRGFANDAVPLLRFDGTSFQPIADSGLVLGNGHPRATDMTVFDEGNGPLLWISGFASTAVSNFQNGGLATFDGSVLAGRVTPFEMGAQALLATGAGGGSDELLITGSGSSSGSFRSGIHSVGDGSIADCNFPPAVLFAGAASDGSGNSVYAGGKSFNRVERLFVDGFAERQRFCSVGDEFCFGEGAILPGCTNCPCGNDAPIGSLGGCLNVAGEGTRLVASGVPSVANDTLRFEVRRMTPLTLGVLFSGENRLPTNASNPCFGLATGVSDGTTIDGLRCMGGPTTRRHGGRGSNADGAIGVTTPGWGLGSGPPGGLISFAGFTAGQTRHFQVFHRDAIAGGCGTGVNTSQGVTIQFMP